MNLKGWEGNCVTCYKKSDNKLYQIAQDNPEKFEFDAYLEDKYGNYVNSNRRSELKRKGKELSSDPIRIFRRNRTVADILEESKTFDKTLMDEHEQYDESCEVFTDCGIDN